MKTRLWEIPSCSRQAPPHLRDWHWLECGKEAFKGGEVRFSDWPRLTEVLQKPVRTGEVRLGLPPRNATAAALQTSCQNVGSWHRFYCSIWLVTLAGAARRRFSVFFFQISPLWDQSRSSILLFYSVVSRVSSVLPPSLLQSRLNRHWLVPWCFDWNNSGLELFNIRSLPASICIYLHLSASLSYLCGLAFIACCISVFILLQSTLRCIDSAWKVLYK